MPKPFDLEKAQAGHPLVTRDGRTAKFIAYVPEVTAPDHHLIVTIASKELTIISRHSVDGSYVIDSESYCDLFLADPPKVTVEFEQEEVDEIKSFIKCYLENNNCLPIAPSVAKILAAKLK